MFQPVEAVQLRSKPMNDDANDGRAEGIAGAVPLARLTDFYQAWVMVDAADPAKFPANARARAFAAWVGLFGFIDHDNVVTEHMEVVATRLSLSRPAWLLYRNLLTEVGLIEQERIEGFGHPTNVRLHPPRF